MKVQIPLALMALIALSLAPGCKEKGAAGTDDAELFEAAQEDDDYLRLSEHPRWASITG
mgnify:CR=1 FL=1